MHFPEAGEPHDSENQVRPGLVVGEGARVLALRLDASLLQAPVRHTSHAASAGRRIAAPDAQAGLGHTTGAIGHAARGGAGRKVIGIRAYAECLFALEPRAKFHDDMCTPIARPT